MMWNRRHLPTPPSCDRKVLLTRNNLGVLSRARQSLTGASQILSEYTGTLRTEQYVLTRYIYKLSSQFRSEKSMKTLRQVKSCLTRLTEADLPSFLFSLHSFVDICQPENGEVYLPSRQMYINNANVYCRCQCQPENSEVYLPSRQMLEYKLVRLMGITALLTQTAAYSQYAYITVRQHVDTGIMLPQNVVMLALSARIWYVTKSLASRVIKWYQALMPCLDVLQPTLVIWLPETEPLPTDLTAWLEEQFGLKQDTGTERSMIKTTQEEVHLDGDGGSVVKLAAFEDLGEMMVRRDPVVDTKDETVELLETEIDINHDQRTLEDSGISGQKTGTGNKRKRLDRADTEQKTGTGNKRKRLDRADTEQKTGTGNKRKRLDRADTENSSKNKSKKVKLKNKGEELNDVKQRGEKVKHKVGSEVFSKDSDVSTFEGDPVQNMKESLKQTLKSFNDVDSFESEVKTKQVQVGNRSVVISKMGKKNILSVIKTVREMVPSAKTNKQQEKRCLKKLWPALSRMLVEYERKGQGINKATAVVEDEMVVDGETVEDEGGASENTASVTDDRETVVDDGGTVVDEGGTVVDEGGTVVDEGGASENTASVTDASRCLKQTGVGHHDVIMLSKKRKKEKKQKKRLENKLTCGKDKNVRVKQERTRKSKKGDNSKRNRGRYFKT